LLENNFVVVVDVVDDADNDAGLYVEALKAGTKAELDDMDWLVRSAKSSTRALNEKIILYAEAVLLNKML